MRWEVIYVRLGIIFILNFDIYIDIDIDTDTDTAILQQCFLHHHRETKAASSLYSSRYWLTYSASLAYVADRRRSRKLTTFPAASGKSYVPVPNHSRYQTAYELPPRTCP